MTTIENGFDATAFERKISQCFEGGQVCSRELRLSEYEADYVRRAYPAALRSMGGSWYEVSFPRATHATKEWF